jgi:hypothetical protein
VSDHDRAGTADGELWTPPDVRDDAALADALADVLDTPDSDLPSGSWLDGAKADTGVSKRELTLTTTQNDPLNAGTTTARHRKARWAAVLWRYAVGDRREDTIHKRGVHYSAFSAGVAVPPPSSTCEWDEYGNTVRHSQYLNDALKEAHRLGLIPADGIRDEKHDRENRMRPARHAFPDGGDVSPFPALHLPRPPTVPKTDDEPYPAWGDAMADAGHVVRDDTYRERAVRMLTDGIMSGLSLDTNAQQPFHVELWTEKTLPSEVTMTAWSAGLDVLVEGEGSISDTQGLRFGERLAEAGKPAVVLYLADHDPAGQGMPVQLANKVEWAKRNPRIGLDERVYVVRLGLTAEQVERHDLPRAPKDPDSADDAHVTELNALEADLSLFQRLVREGIARYHDDELAERNREAREDYREAVKEAVADAVEAAGVEDRLDGLTEWMDRYDEAHSEVGAVADDLREIRDRLGELKDEDAYREFREAHESVPEHVALPEFDVPDSTESAPDDPLYDSARPYAETVERVKRTADGATIEPARADGSGGEGE